MSPPQSKSVKRIRSSVAPQLSLKKTMTSRLADPSTSYAAVAGQQTAEKQPSTEKASISSGKANSKVRSQRQRKPYDRPNKVAADEDLQVAIIDKSDPCSLKELFGRPSSVGRTKGIVNFAEGCQSHQLSEQEIKGFLVKTVGGFGALWERANLAAYSLSETPTRRVLLGSPTFSGQGTPAENVGAAKSKPHLTRTTCYAALI